jgi:prepilin-type N-terminal cleavage/methylation domain-containing protein
MAQEIPIKLNESRKSMSARSRFSAGFTLVEMMISVVISVFVIACIVTLAIISAQNFAATSNYVQMDAQSRNALDRASREIRSATALMSFSTNYPQFLLLTNAYKGTSTTIFYSNNCIVMRKTGWADQTLLTGCDGFSFQLFSRSPLIINNNISFYNSTNPTTGNVDQNYCKVINLGWKCSRTIIGSKLSTEVVQSAQVILRNQVSQ